MKAEKYRKEKKNAKQKVNKFRRRETLQKNLKIEQKIICWSFKRPEMCFWKDLELDEGRKVQKGEGTCETKRSKKSERWQTMQKMWIFSRKLFAGVSKGLKCILERTWSQMKAEKYRKEKKNAKLKGKKIIKIRNNAEKCEYLSHLEQDEGRKAL